MPKRVIEINPRSPAVHRRGHHALPDKDKNQRRSSVSELIVELEMAKFVGHFLEFSTLATPGLPPPW